MQLGLKDKLANSTDPWLCYYCGECSETCPRDANPGELMMSFRRWLTIKYDWTGISKLLYKSFPALLFTLIIIAVGVIAVGYVKDFNTKEIMQFGHDFERNLLLIVPLLILIPNIIRMFWFTVLREKVKVPISAYITNLVGLFVNIFTQKKFLKCDSDSFRWFEHFLIVIGYIALLIITVFLDWFNAESEIIIWGGYIVGALVFIFTFDFVLRRSRKKRESSRFSHPTDWMFVIWLFLMGLTAFIVRIFIDAGTIDNNLWMYFIHMIVMAQWGILIVPFGKWTHFLYRPFALYFSNLKQASVKN